MLSACRIPRINAVILPRVRTCRHELLNRTLNLNQRHLLQALCEYETFYNERRPHHGHPQCSVTTPHVKVGPPRIRSHRPSCPDDLLGRRRGSAPAASRPAEQIWMRPTSDVRGHIATMNCQTVVSMTDHGLITLVGCRCHRVMPSAWPPNSPAVSGATRPHGLRIHAGAASRASCHRRALQEGD